MPSHTQLIRRAKKMGHEITPTLSAELLMLASVSDEKIFTAARRSFVKVMAAEFKVPVSFAERRLEGIGPYLAQRREPNFDR